MLLAIDIGNTNVTLGVFKLQPGQSSQKLVKIWRLSTNKNMTDDEYGIKILNLLYYSSIDANQIKGIGIANVVPSLNPAFIEMSKKYFNKTPIFVDSSSLNSKKILYDNPVEIGADRIANAVAAFDMFGGPAIIIDFGTATTFDCIDKKGSYLGGVIAPGPAISSEALAKRTAKLPRVEICKPDKVIGKSTIKGIQSGLYYGYAGLIKEILFRIKLEMEDKVKIIATGGLANLIVPEIRGVSKVVPELTLEGIKIIWGKFSKN